MKKAISIIIGGALMAACSGREQRLVTGLDDFAHSAEASATAVAAAAGTLAEEPAVMPPLTSQGIGPLRLGMNPRNVPQKLPGVYDSVAVSRDEWEGDSFTGIEFFLRGVKTIDAMAIADTARIDAITLLAGAPAINIDGTKVGIGTPASTLARLKGVHALPDSPDGARRREWHGVTIYIAADTVTAISLGES